MNKRFKIISLGLLAFLLLFILGSGPLAVEEKKESVFQSEILSDISNIETEQENDTEHTSRKLEPQEDKEIKDEQEKQVDQEEKVIEKFLVDKVVDGDTIIILKNNEKVTIRFIGINTPESVHPRKGVECYGKEASLYLREKLTGSWVSLEYDESQGILDKYNRTLAYVRLGDENINKTLISLGYAHEYTYKTPYIYQSEFKTEEEKAQREGRGLWASDTCNGKLSSSESPSSETPKKENNANILWHVSSHYSSKYYYCPESDGWRTLSEAYLRDYSTESALKKDFPSHILHWSCE
ncbi:MAG: micrococcal nuclease [Flavobacteriaceae bacterium]|jgi:micrococcal nuclease